MYEKDIEDNVGLYTEGKITTSQTDFDEWYGEVVWGCIEENLS